MFATYAYCPSSINKPSQPLPQRLRYPDQHPEAPANIAEKPSQFFAKVGRCSMLDNAKGKRFMLRGRVTMVNISGKSTSIGDVEFRQPDGTWIVESSVSAIHIEIHKYGQKQGIPQANEEV